MSEQHEVLTKTGEKKMISFLEMSVIQKSTIIRKRLKDYSRTVYKKTHTQVIEDKTSTVCMRENAFYIDTVRAFRDRRYTYKGKKKRIFIIYF
jgi:DNA polymerase epsilon subunit 1